MALALPAFAAPDGKIHLQYWEKWTGEEENAMQQVVDAFNRSQDKIVVDFLSVGQIEQKTLLATAGGDPPDIAGVYLQNVCSFVDRDALTPLDGFIQADGSTPEKFLGRYAKAYAKIGTYRGKLWGVPSTPSVIALYWNKDRFRAAGLDPEKPPRTIAELESMSEKLTVYDEERHLKKIGFLPQLQAGWIWAFPQWFGGQLFDGEHVTIGTAPPNLKAFQWVADYSSHYKQDEIRRLTSSFGTLASPQDPFNSGQAALLLDGVWRHHFIELYAPGLNYGVTGWPEAQPGVGDFTFAESDMLVIPHGAKHPREAWTFLNYVSSPNLSAQSLKKLQGVELLCFLQQKASPLSEWSPFFEKNNPNPDLKTFRQLAESPHAIHCPEMGIWEQYHRELNVMFDKVRLQLESPEEALNHCQARVESSWDWHRERLARRKGFSADAAASNQPPSP